METFLWANKEIWIDVKNSDFQYMFISHHKDSGQTYN